MKGVYQERARDLAFWGRPEIVPSSRGLLDDAEIYEKFGAPLHERTMEDVESRSIYHGSLHGR